MKNYKFYLLALSIGALFFVNNRAVHRQD